MCHCTCIFREHLRANMVDTIGKSLIVALLLALLFKIVLAENSATTIYVIPSRLQQIQCPPTKLCYTLSELAANNVTDMTNASNTTILLLPGDHNIARNGHLLFQNTTNLEILGNTHATHVTERKILPRVKILCPDDTTLGFTFTNVTNLTISNIAMNGCGVPSPEERFRNLEMNHAISIAYSYNVTIKHVTITNCKGIGLFLYNVYISLTISQSLFSRNDVNCYIAIAGGMFTDTRLYRATILISKSNFTHGNISASSYISSGLTVIARNMNILVQAADVLLLSNSAPNGNFYIDLQDRSNLNANIYRLNATSDLETSSSYGIYFGGGTDSYLFSNVSIVDSIFNRTCVKAIYGYHDITRTVTTALIKRSIIDRCRGMSLFAIGGKHFIVEDVNITNSAQYMATFIEYDEVIIRGNCTFQNNMGSFLLVGTSAINFEENSTTSFMFNNATCMIDYRCCSTFCLIGGHFVVRNNAHVSFKDNIAEHSGGLLFDGESLGLFDNTSSITFENNTGTNGGAMFIKYDTLIHARQGIPTITFIRNKALAMGGAIYTPTSTEVCRRRSAFPVLFHFINNTALLGGSAIYGNIQSIADPNQNPLIGCDQSHIIIEGKNNDYSFVSSDPVRICVCKDSVPQCNITTFTVRIFPSQMLEIEVAAVGLGYGTVTSVIRAEYDNEDYSWRKIGGGQYMQQAQNNCTTLRYETSIDTIQMRQLSLTPNGSNEIIHQLQNSMSPMFPFDGKNLLIQTFVIVFDTKNCSLGFTFLPETNECKCQEALLDHGIECNLATLNEIFRAAPKWINATFMHNIDTEPGVIVHNHCPFDYCRSDIQQLALNLEYPDHQCAFNRSGTLCGACATNLSHVFGTSQCKQCSSLWVLLYVPIFALAGFILVVFLTTLNMTVSIGTINGLIFYANIVRANQAIFFTPDTTNSFLSRFIAWLNLDIGIEICFYHGLDAYFKTWLQFIFPLYIWLIVITIIVLSRYYTTFARLSGSNAVQVLATLFLLSYAKLLRNIVTVFQPTTLVYPDGYNRRVWLYDGNIDYFKGKHIPLFIAALLLLVLLSIPYTTILLTIQWLQKRNEYRVLFWVRKFKPLFDAYTGPYKESHRFWTGLLLLIRVVLFLIFSLNTANNPSINLLAINATTIIILTHLSLVGRVYESRLANIIEVAFYLNIGLLSAATFYQVNTSGNKTQITYTSTGVAFVSFMAITFYHVLTRLLETRRGTKFKTDIKSKFKNNVMDRVNVIAAPTPAPVTHSSIELREPLLVT